MKCCGYGWCAWHIRDCGVCVVGKIAKDVGTAIRKSIVVSFLLCLVTFLRFHPYMLLHFKMFLK